MKENFNNEEKSIFSQDKIVINEDTLYGNDGYYIGIFNEYGRNYVQDPYFKISWRTTFPDRCTIRVKFSGTEYVIHGGIKIIIPTKNLRELNNIIRLPYDNNSLGRLYNELGIKDNELNIQATVWDAMLLTLIKKYPGEFGPIGKINETFNNLATKYRPIDFCAVQYPNGKYQTNRWGS